MLVQHLQLCESLELKCMVGPRFSSYTGQHQDQQRGFTGGTFDFQTMEATVSV